MALSSRIQTRGMYLSERKSVDLTKTYGGGVDFFGVIS